MTGKDRIIVALDVDSLEKAVRLAEMLSPYVGCFKVGLELLTACGAPQIVRAIQGVGGEVFLDGKFNDIPSTVAGACRSAAALGVRFFDVHAACGQEAMAAAAKVKGRSQLLAVTVLTSLDHEASRHIFGREATEKVVQFAQDALSAEADGIVCSPQELSTLAHYEAFEALLKVTPGVRPEWAPSNDQRRVMTPKQAISLGATHLVIGRPILQPPRDIDGPVEAAKRIAAEIEEAMV